jgi:hypothetical protein
MRGPFYFLNIEIRVTGRAPHHKINPRGGVIRRRCMRGWMRAPDNALIVF